VIARGHRPRPRDLVFPPALVVDARPGVLVTRSRAPAIDEDHRERVPRIDALGVPAVVGEVVDLGVASGDQFVPDHPGDPRGGARRDVPIGPEFGDLGGQGERLDPRGGRGELVPEVGTTLPPVGARLRTPREKNPAGGRGGGRRVRGTRRVRRG